MHATAPSAACQCWISLHALQMYFKFVSWYIEQCSFATVYAHVSCIYMIMRLVFTSMFAHAPWVSFLWNRERIKREMHTFTLHAAQNVHGWVNTYKISPGHPLNSITAAFFSSTFNHLKAISGVTVYIAWVACTTVRVLEILAVIYGF